ncbi:hypothetical protein C8F01DRAFT_1248130 [Mycena amicta]|nr:hypothetical protein C8F01DRAFT_1248130 [Mycena amicta]
MSKSPASPAAPAPVLLYMGPIRPGHTVAMMFEESGTSRLFAFPFTKLADAEAADRLLDFPNHPIQCSECMRPFKRTSTACFTYIFTCPHWPDDTPDPTPNRAIAAILLSFSSEPLHPPLGNVLVVKQTPLAPGIADDQPVPRAEAMALPLSDITLADLEDIKRYLVEYLPAMWTAGVDGWRYFVLDEVADKIRTSGGQRVFGLRVPEGYQAT